MSVPWHVPVLFGAVGVVLTTLGARELVRTVRWRRRCVRAAGVIWSLRVEAESEGGPYHVPTFAFRATNKRRYEVESNVARGTGHWKVGDAVSVVYDPAEPQRAEIAGHDFFHPLLLLGLGIPALAATLLVLLVMDQ